MIQKSIYWKKDTVTLQAVFYLNSVDQAAWKGLTLSGIMDYRKIRHWTLHV